MESKKCSLILDSNYLTTRKMKQFFDKISHNKVKI